MASPSFSTITKYFDMKDPADVVDLSFDWSELMSDYPGDTIINAVIASDANNVTITPAILSSDNVVTSYVSGGTDGSTPVISSTITTAANRVFRRSGYLPIGHRS